MPLCRRSALLIAAAITALALNACSKRGEVTANAPPAASPAAPPTETRPEQDAPPAVSTPAPDAVPEAEIEPESEPPPVPDVAAFARFRPDQLVPFILGNQTLSNEHLGEKNQWCDQTVAAMDWFLYRTRTVPRRRQKLAQRITDEILNGYDVHDFLGRPTLLGQLGAHEQLVTLLVRDTDLECCFYQETLDALWECATRDDMPRLITLMEQQEDAFVIADLLEEIAGEDAPDDADAAAWRAWLQERQDAE
jgi:hypothetical protein